MNAKILAAIALIGVGAANYESEESTNVGYLNFEPTEFKVEPKKESELLGMYKTEIDGMPATEYRFSPMHISAKIYDN